MPALGGSVNGMLALTLRQFSTAHSMGEIGKRTHSEANLSSNFDARGFKEDQMIGARTGHLYLPHHAELELNHSSSDDSRVPNLR